MVQVHGVVRVPTLSYTSKHLSHTLNESHPWCESQTPWLPQLLLLSCSL